VRSPLVEAGFHKEDIRRCAALLGLSVSNKPAAACLSSRIPYGTPVTRERLTQIGTLEAAKSPPDGVVTGRMIVVGGAAPGSPRPVSGR